MYNRAELKQEGSQLQPKVDRERDEIDPPCGLDPEAPPLTPSGTPGGAVPAVEEGEEDGRRATSSQKRRNEDEQQRGEREEDEAAKCGQNTGKDAAVTITGEDNEETIRGVATGGAKAAEKKRR